MLVNSRVINYRTKLAKLLKGKYQKYLLSKTSFMYLNLRTDLMFGTEIPQILTKGKTLF